MVSCDHQRADYPRTQLLSAWGHLLGGSSIKDRKVGQGRAVLLDCESSSDLGAK